MGEGCSSQHYEAVELTGCEKELRRLEEVEVKPDLQVRYRWVSSKEFTNALSFCRCGKATLMLDGIVLKPFKMH